MTSNGESYLSEDHVFSYSEVYSGHKMRVSYQKVGGRIVYNFTVHRGVELVFDGRVTSFQTALLMAKEFIHRDRGEA